MATTINFPAIAAPSWSLGEKYLDSTIRSSFENGMEQTRTKYTRKRKEYAPVSWAALKHEEYLVLDAFYSATTDGGALSFNWTHPLTGVVKEVRFSAPPEATLIGPNYWEVKISLREV